MVNLNNSCLNLMKGDIINLSVECYRIIDDYGFNFYRKQNGENIK